MVQADKGAEEMTEKSGEHWWSEAGGISGYGDLVSVNFEPEDMEGFYVLEVAVKANKSLRFAPSKVRIWLGDCSHEQSGKDSA